MPLLSFEIYSNYQEVIRLRQEIERLEDTLKSFGPGTAESTIRNIESQLQATRAQFNALAEDAVRAGAEIEKSVRASVAKASKNTEVKVKMKADNTDFRKKNAEMLKDMDDTLNKLSEYGESINGVFKNISSLAGFSIPLMGVMTFLEHVKSVRSEFQDMESSMQVFLGSEEKGSIFMQQLQDYAWYNMFDFKDLVAASQQMIAYGNSVESIIPAIDKLSNIATATHAPLGEMVALFNKAKATGFVDAQAIQSWALKGLVIKDVLKEMGEKAQGSKITFEQLNKVLTHVTSEGGMFHGIMDSQMNNISASIGQLQDNTDLMFNEIGESMQEPLRKIIDVAAYLVDHFKEVAATLAAAGISYGAFKVGSVMNEKATQAAMQETLDKLNEIKETSSELTLDEDIQKALDSKLISKEDAEQWQSNRNELAELNSLKEEEERRKAVAEAMDAEIEKLRELNDEKEAESEAETPSGPKLDADLQQIADSGMADDEMVNALQEQRDLLREKSEIAEQNLALADQEHNQAIANRDSLEEQVQAAQRRKDEADALVEKLQEEHDLLSEDDLMNAPLDEYGQVTESVETLMKAEELEEAQKEALARASELAAAQTALESAEEQVNTTETALNTAQTDANAAAINLQVAATSRHTTAETANTAATAANTGATTANSTATKLSAMWDRTAAGAKLLFSNAIKQVTTSIHAMKVAIMTNPIGMLITAITTVIGLFMAFKDSAEEASEEVTRFGESAVKTRRNVETLYAVLDSVNVESKVHRDAVSELLKSTKEYGIQVKDEADLLSRLNEIRAEHIELINKEGEARQLANRLASYENDKTKASDDFVSKMAESIEDENDGDAEANARRFAEIIAGTVELKKKELLPLVQDLKQAQEDYAIEAAKGEYADGTKLKQLRDDIASLQTTIAQAANEDAVKMARNLGLELGKTYKLDIKDTSKLVSELVKQLDDADRFIDATKENARTVNEELNALKVESPFDPESFLDIDDLFKDYDKRIEEINNTPVEPQANTEQIDAVTESASEAQDGVENLDASSAEPTTDTGQIDDVTASADNATTAMGVLDSTKATPFINSSWVTNFSTKLNEAWVGLQKLMGIENPTPLIKTGDAATKTPAKTPAQQKQDLTQAFHDDITRRINAAKTTEDFDTIRKALQARQKKTDQNSTEYTWLENQLKALDKRDKSKKKNKSGSKDDPKQREYEARKIQLENDKRLAELKLAEENRLLELELAQMDDNSEKKIATIRFNAKKEREALEQKAQKEAEILEKNDLQIWLKGGKNRKEYQYYAQFTEAQLKQMRENYLAQARENIGFDTQFALNSNKETSDLQDVYKEDLQAMQDYLKEYGTFQQKKLAIAQEYAEKIRLAQNEGEKLALQAKEKSDLQEVEDNALMSQIDWYSVFDNVGIIMQGQLEPLYKQLQAYVKTDDFRKSGADNQSKVIEAMENLREQLGDNKSWRDLASALSAYQNALKDLRIATEKDAKVTEEMGKLMAAQTSAQANLDEANARLAEVVNDPNHTDAGLQEANNAVALATEQVAAASQAVSNYGATVQQSSLELQTAQNSVKSFGTMLSQTAKSVTKPISKLTTFFSNAGFSQLAELWSAFDGLKGAIDGLKGLSAFQEAQDAIKKLSDAASEGAESFADALADSPQMVQDAMQKLGLTFSDFADSAGDAADKLSQEVADATSQASDAVLEGTRAGIDAMAKGLGKAGLIAGLIASILKILDVLADGVGPLISAILDSILNAVAGIIGNILNFKEGLFRQIGESLYKGILGIFKSIFTLGGWFDWWGNGESDKNLEKDIERLTNTNEALRKAVDNLTDVMQESAVAQASELYQQQKSNIEQSMANTQEMMSRAGAAYSNGFLGVGGHKSSNKKINDAMSKGEWARISKIVGKTVNSASDFWNLTSEQMAKVAQDAPDLYGKIKQYADDGYKDAAQFMDEYIEYYKELEELENAYRERLTDVSLDSVKDEFKSMLLDMESDTEDFAESFEKLMQQAVINSLMSSKYNERIQKWYEDFAAAMEGDDATITAAEQERLRREWDDIVEDATNDRDRLKSTMGWDGSQTQQSSSRTLAGMSQDTGEAIEGRLTALQIAVESIRTNEQSQTLSIAELNNDLIEVMQEYSRFNVHYDNIERQLAKIYVELLTISENTGAIVKPIQTMQEDIAQIKKNTQNL